MLKYASWILIIMITEKKETWIVIYDEKIKKMLGTSQETSK